MGANLTVRNVNIGGGRPKVCVPLVGRTDENVISEADRIRSALSLGSGIDIVELRIDYYEAVNDADSIKKLLEKVRHVLPDEVLLLYTLRSEREGGEQLPEGADYITAVEAGLESGIPDIIDVELDAPGRPELVEAIRSKGKKIILSKHFFDSTPEDELMLGLITDMEAAGADIAKLAVMPKDKQDVIRLMSVTEQLTRDVLKIPLITMSMGRLGAVSRACGGLFGSAATFGSLFEASAPGQIPVVELNKIIELLDANCG
ncbi:MAG: type I 3-dehydroquinate dehydratase [Lachnospiraceae bacterium]|nr:type I 3-dehydroquinate dehydratase [Lachnospiraceae bacterium]